GPPLPALPRALRAAEPGPGRGVPAAPAEPALDPALRHHAGGRRDPAHRGRRQIREEAARQAVTRLAEDRPPRRVRDPEPLARPRDRDVRQPALLLDVALPVR